MTVLERSRRSAGTSYAHSDAFKEFLERLRNSDKSLGDSDGRVLRLKRYLPSDVGPKIMNSVIEALSLNTNVEALYIQNFEKGMHDEQLARLVEVLKERPIWALNIGENFRITHFAWGEFLKELPLTSVSYLYVSEHHLKGTKLKDQMRDAIRENRKQIGPKDVEVIKQIHNMWYNPKTPEQLAVAKARREEQERKRVEKEMREKERLRALKKKLKKKNKKNKSAHKKKTKTKKKAKKTKKRSVKQYKATLEDLVKSGLLANGEDILYYYPKGKGTKPFEAKVTFSEETQKCAIVAEKPGGTYKSLSQYALACVHTKTPTRAAVCGWLDVYIKASGKKLFDVRNDFLVKDN